jgi:hypothetical protein
MSEKLCEEIDLGPDDDDTRFVLISQPMVFDNSEWNHGCDSPTEFCVGFWVSKVVVDGNFLWGETIILRWFWFSMMLVDFDFLLFWESVEACDTNLHITGATNASVLLWHFIMVYCYYVCWFSIILYML